MEVSCSRPPRRTVVEQPQLIESLGRRLRAADSPALFPDPRAALALVQDNPSDWPPRAVFK